MSRHVDVEDPPLDEPVETVEADRGIVVTRRTLLATMAGAVVACGARTVAAQRVVGMEGATLSYEDFLREAIPAAKQLVCDTSRVGQDGISTRSPRSPLSPPRPTRGRNLGYSWVRHPEQARARPGRYARPSHLVPHDLHDASQPIAPREPRGARGFDPGARSFPAKPIRG
jgi:hypothetical protein